MKAKVSVIVPVYNVEEYLPKCLDSLINQTLKDIEIIVVNDGSPDNSQKIIEKYKKKDKRIISLIKENGGQGSARNLGLEKAKGEYISYVDSDDWIELDMLERMYDKAKKDKLDIVICAYQTVSKNEINKIFIDNKLMKDTLDGKKNRILNIVSPCCKIYKRKLLIDNAIAFAEDIWYEDFAYSTKVLVKTNKIGFVNETFYNYYTRENSTMNNPNIIKMLDLITAFDDIVDFYRNNYLYDEYYEELEFLAIDNFSYGMARLIKMNGDKKDKKRVLDEYHSYLRKHFYNLSNNKYLATFSKKRKIIYKLLLKKQYKLIEIIFKLGGKR